MDLLGLLTDWKPLGALFSAAVAVYAARRRPRRPFEEPGAPSLPSVPLSGKTTRFFRWIGEIGASPVTLRVERLEAAARSAKEKKTIEMLTRELALRPSTPTPSNGSSSDLKATTLVTTNGDPSPP